MWRLAWRRLVARPSATLVTATGLLVAVLGYLLLLGTARTTQATLDATIERSWQGPYQLLVRPADSQAELEVRDGLIRPNFLSALTGGITLEHLTAIRATPQVELVAPIAVAGYLNWPSGLPLDLEAYVDPASSATLLRVTTTAVGDAGGSAYPAETTVRYLLVAPQGEIVGYRTPSESLRIGDATVPCMRHEVRLFCYGGDSPESAPLGMGPGIAGLWVYLPQPLLVAGVDPAAETELFALDRCIVDGRGLEPRDAPRREADAEGIPHTVIPAIFSDRSFIDEEFTFTVDRLDDVGAFVAGGEAALTGLWSRVGDLRASPDAAYRAGLGTAGDELPISYVTPLWTVGDVQYRSVGPDHLAALPQASDPSIFNLTTGDAYRQPEASDQWFRPVEAHVQIPRGDPEPDFPVWAQLGRYDPDCLAGFDPSAGGRLDAYSVPELRLPDGRLLGPTRSPAGYVTSPPIALTTLDGAGWFADPTHFAGRDPKAFISAVRVRVRGAEHPGADAERILLQVAGAIRERTGLTVDAVVGSSNRTIRIDLPAGRYGRPMLTLGEGWAVKGVALRFTEAVTTQDLFLLTSLLAAAFLLVSETVLVGVRARRQEFELLRALGWSDRRIAVLVEIETMILGMVVGLIAGLAGAAALLVSGTPIESLGQAAVAPIVAVAISAPAGLVAVRLALRRPAPTHGRTRGIGGVASSPVALALRDLFHLRRSEVLIGGLAIAVGGAVLGVLLIAAQAFVDQLDFTVLGVRLAATVHPFHLALAALTIGVGALAGAEVVLLGYQDRQQDFAALRALGWPRRALLEVLMVEGVAIGVAGGLLGAAVVVTFGALAGAPQDVVLRSAAAAGALAALSTFLATAIPFVYAYRSPVAASLREE